MKQTLSLLLLLLLAGVLPACVNSRVGQVGGAQNLADEHDLKICLLDSSAVDGQDWILDIYEALQRAEDDLGADLRIETAQSRRDHEKVLQAYGKGACAVVVGRGVQFQEAALSAASRYPGTFFLVVDSRISNDANVIGVSVDSRQAFYLLGVMAAEMGSRAGLVGGAESMPVTEAFAGFVEGAHAVDPDFPVSEVYLDDWDAVAGGKQAALSLLAGGADFVVPYAGTAALGVYHAVVEENKWTFGVISDKIEQAPKNITASYTADYGQAVVNIASQIKAGVFEPSGNIVFGLADEDVVLFSYNEGSDNPAPQALRDEVEQVRALIAAGGLDQ